MTIVRSVTVGRRTIEFSVHAMERYYERAEKRTVAELRVDLENASYDRSLPRWVQVSTWHRALAQGSLVIDDNRAFVLNRNSEGNLFAVTYLEREPIPG